MDAARRLKDLLGYLAYRGAAAVLALVPAALVPRAGAALGRLAFRWSGERRLMAQRHMQRVLGPQSDARASAAELFANYGRYWAEVFWLRPGRVARVQRHLSTEGLEHFRAARDGQKGIILAIPHLGNWEVAGPVARREGVPLVAVAEALPNPRISRWFIDLRRAFGIEVVLADRSGGASRTLLTRLRRGEAVALLADRDITGGGVPVEFFGEQTTLPAGPAALADRTGAAVLPVAVYFRAGRGHHAVIKPPLALPKDGSKEERVRSGAGVVARALEELIRVAPTQWHLLQPNWPSDRSLGQS